MPIYAFKCKTCDRQWDDLMSYDASEKLELIACPTCHEFTVEKQVTAPGMFDLKGGGWYKPGIN
jgi:putative FmdB family regulatory protein